MYPFQLLTSNMPLATILEMSAATQLGAVLGRGPVPAATIPIVSEMLALQGGAKCQHHLSNLKQEEEETVNQTTLLKNIPTESGKTEGQQQRLLKSLTARLFLRSQQ